MKRFIAVLALMLTGFVFASTANAQDGYYQDRYYQDRDRYQEYNRRYDHDRRNRRDYNRRVYVVYEQRYVPYGREVYRFIYRCMYRGDRLINRQLVRRERVSFNHRNGYRTRQGLQFNVFLRF